MSAPIPVLWITGPAGVGKSTVSWQLFTELAQAGVPVAFVDTDQLAMCYPAPPGDPGRERIKAANFGALLPGYALAERIGFRGEGGGWNEPGDPLRGQPTAFLDRVIDEAVAQAQALERADVPMIGIDTSGRTAAESADEIATSILHNDLEDDRPVRGCHSPD